MAPSREGGVQCGERCSVHSCPALRWLDDLGYVTSRNEVCFLSKMSVLIVPTSEVLDGLNEGSTQKA